MTRAQLLTQAAAIYRRAEYGNATESELALAADWLRRAVEGDGPLTEQERST